MDKSWDEIMDGVDWDAVDREVEKLREAEGGQANLWFYFDKDGFDYKRSYIRKVMATHPEITNQFTVDAASEQMYESHTEGVELDVDDALRFVENDKPVPLDDLVKMLNAAGVTSENVMDVIETTLYDTELGVYGTVKNSSAKAKGHRMERCANILSKNPDVLLLGLPTFDPDANWTQVKLAFFSENFSQAEISLLNALMQMADKNRMTVEHGVAVAVFQIYNIWSDFS